MSRKQISFFASGADLRIVLERTYEKMPFRVVDTELPSGVPERLRLEDVDGLSRAAHGDQAKERAFLLVRPKAEISARIVELKGGGSKKFLDQLSHPESVMLHPGGDFKDAVIAGQAGTVSENEWAAKLNKTLAKEIARAFSKVKSYYVGTTAAEALGRGTRLTTNVRAPSEYDLCP